MRRLPAILVLALMPAAATAASSQPAELPQRETLRAPLEPPSASVSGDGRYVAFASRSPLSPLDTNTLRDVYVLDRATGRITLESVAPNGASWNADSDMPRLSADGRHVAYEVLTPVYVGGALRGQMDIMLRDRHTGQTRRVTTAAGGGAANGWSRLPSVSGDGRFVVFTSTATNLVDGADLNGVAEDVYLADMRTGEIRRVSLGADGAQSARGASFAGVVSRDGRSVAFSSTAYGRTKRCHVYVRDLALDETRLVSAAAGGTPANGPSSHPSLSDDGRLVAFVSEATNLTSGDRNRAPDVFVWNRETGGVTLISRSARSGTANASSTNPAISGGGRYVSFQSLASDLVCTRCAAADEDINLLWDVFVMDRATGAIARLSGDATEGWLEASSGPAIDAAGAIVVFSSRHPIDENDVAADEDLFVRPFTAVASAAAARPVRRPHR